MDFADDSEQQDESEDEPDIARDILERQRLARATPVKPATFSPAGSRQNFKAKFGSEPVITVSDSEDDDGRKRHNDGRRPIIEAMLADMITTVMQSDYACQFAMFVLNKFIALSCFHYAY